MAVEIPKTIELEQKVFNINNAKEFNSIALEVYQFQFRNNELYQDYCKALNKIPDEVRIVNDIPFLPISFFKSHRIATTAFDPERIFTSSGTTGLTTSAHYVKSAGIYEQSFLEGFKHFYGNPEDYCILALLPSYLEREGSSLVYMANRLIQWSGHAKSGFYLDDLKKLSETIRELETGGQKTLLIGVTFALLDFARDFPLDLQNTQIMETGGMKGRGRELTREELYLVLKQAFGVGHIHSEYGMTELLSQAYGIDGKFKTQRWMQVLLRDETDPFTLLLPEKMPVSGVINVIDLANLYSCSFIATEDLGKLYQDGSFEVLGRMDHTDVRGCSQLVTGY